jgi:hypothetical protein
MRSRSFLPCSCAVAALLAAATLPTRQASAEITFFGFPLGKRYAIVNVHRVGVKEPELEDYKVPMENFQVWQTQQKSAKKEVYVTGYCDPWVGYNVEFNNSSDEDEFIGFTIEMPVTEVDANVVSSQLTIDLIDANNDGQASLVRALSSESLQRAYLFSTSDESIPAPNWDLGLEDLASPGSYLYEMPPSPGPVNTGLDTLSILNRFLLSPGDTVQLRGLLVIDDGTETPTPEIPPLPQEAGGPFSVVINSPDWAFGDDDWLGAYTQVNVRDGGSIGERFNFQAYRDNLLDDYPIYSEVNVTGGTVGNQFMALSSTTVNISGGSIDGIFIAGSYDGTSSDVEVNISGGAFNRFGWLQAYPGSVVNISGGQLALISASGGVVNIAGGQFGSLGAFSSLQDASIQAVVGGVVNIAGGGFPTANIGYGEVSVLRDSVLNVSGGSFLAAVNDLEARSGGEVNLFGAEFFIDGVAIDGLIPGEPLTIVQRGVTLSGLLADGSPFSIDLVPTDPIPTEEDPFPVTRDLFDPAATLTVTLELPGDFDGNGVADGADFLAWQRQFGMTGDGLTADGNGDGAVGAADLALWRNRYPSAGQSAAVPEPGAASMIGLAAVGLLTCHHLREGSEKSNVAGMLRMPLPESP